MKLSAAFFEKDALEIAPQLVGMKMCRHLPDGSILSARITETEIYRGEEDLGCHASKGKTKRNEIMYCRGGHAYIYLVYGMHWLFNVVTGPENMPQAVLIRALEAPLNGPAKWTKAFSVTGELNGSYLPQNDEIWIEDAGEHPLIRTAPRVGIDYAGEPWKSIPWRFIADEGGK
ncbi:MAG: DNA-3-methyladenine glycosylase [Clostridiales bacterium]|nr:DNA-3-methyladenine glycosylase [Clostridiales bacterium]